MGAVGKVSTAVAVAFATAAVSVGTVGAAPAAKRITLNDACTIVTAKQLKTFGTPVSAGEPLQGGFACRYTVGDPAGTGGTFTAIQFAPNVLASDADSAPLQVEDTRAIDVLSKNTVKDADVGDTAYLNLTKRELTAAYDKDYAVTINWTTAAPGELTKKDAKKLVAIAKAIGKRTPKS
jgi:hypothetical protein